MISRRVLGRMGLAALLGGSVLGSRGLAQESQETPKPVADPDRYTCHIATAGFIKAPNFVMVIGVGDDQYEALQCAQKLAKHYVHGDCDHPDEVTFFYVFHSIENRPDPCDCNCDDGAPAFPARMITYDYELSNRSLSRERVLRIIASTEALSDQAAENQAKLMAIQAYGPNGQYRLKTKR